MTLEQNLEAILFHKTEPVDIAWLAQVLNIEQNQVLDVLNNLKDQLENRGIRVVIAGNKVTLATAPETADILDSITKKDEASDLGKAGLETLSLILYKNPISRVEIDYIRGVNSGFIIRLLTIRGLIERIKDPNNNKGYLYQPTIKLLTWLGLSEAKDLPDYQLVTSKLNDFLTAGENSSNSD